MTSHKNRSLSVKEAIGQLKAGLIDEELTHGQTDYSRALRIAIVCLQFQKPDQVDMHDGVESELFP